MSQESTRFGKYRLLQRIGAGGMGEVHLAKLKGPSGFEKLVVIKRLLPNRREEQRFVDMFFSEAQVTAQLNHSNIVQIYEVDNLEGVPYIAMEYVRGKSLRHVLDAVRRRAARQDGLKRKLPCLPAQYIVQIFVQLCQGLAFAHDARHMSGATLGLIHRDINPHNVLLTYRGEVKLIDFGIAKSELTLDKTQAGTIKGTVIYMSPEQSAGRKLDRRSDMFAVGICLYEMLTGKNPFQKNNMAASLESIRQAKVPPLDMDNPQIAPFASIVYRALAKNPDARFADCDEMGQALNTLLDEGVVPRLELSLGEFLQRLFADAIEEEDSLLSRTEVVESADLAAFVANHKPQEIQGEKTVALGGRSGFAKMESDLHTVADSPYGAALSDELSGIGAPLKLQELESADDARPTQNLGPVDEASLAPAFAPPSRPTAGPTLQVPEDEAQTLGHFDLGSLGGASAPRVRASAKARFKDAYNTAEPKAFVAPHEAPRHAPVEAVDLAQTEPPVQSGFWDISWRRLQFIHAPKAFWAGLPASERLTLAVIGSVVLLSWICVGLALRRSENEASPAAQSAAAPSKEASADSTQNAGATKLAPPTDTNQPASAEVPRPQTPPISSGEPEAYNEELHIDAMAETLPPGAPEEALPSSAPRPQSRRPQAIRRRTATRVVAEAGPASLLVGMEPAVVVLKDGQVQSRSIKLHNQAGVLQFEPAIQAGEPTSFGIKIHYHMGPKGMLYSIESDPWANVIGAGGLSLGRTPIREMLGSTTTVLEFRNPHIATSQRISLHLSQD